MITKLMKMLEDGRDSPLLRFSIAKALAAAGQFENAAYHLQEAIRQDPDYSAAWAELGECRARLGDNDGAITAWVEGMSVAVRTRRHSGQETDGSPAPASAITHRATSFGGLITMKPGVMSQQDGFAG